MDIFQQLTVPLSEVLTAALNFSHLLHDTSSHSGLNRGLVAGRRCASRREVAFTPGRTPQRPFPDLTLRAQGLIVGGGGVVLSHMQAPDGFSVTSSAKRANWTSKLHRDAERVSLFFFSFFK